MARVRYLGSMRFLIPLVFASPAAAWEFSPTPICTLTQSEPGIEVIVTYDQAVPEYTIILTRANPWPEAGLFQMSFTGSRSFTITTDRHVLSDDRKSLSVIDSGFGNVLDGLQYNERVAAISGEVDVSFDLTDAAPAVAAFRECPAVVTS